MDHNRPAFAREATPEEKALDAATPTGLVRKPIPGLIGSYAVYDYDHPADKPAKNSNNPILHRTMVNDEGEIVGPDFWK